MPRLEDLLVVIVGPVPPNGARGGTCSFPSGKFPTGSSFRLACTLIVRCLAMTSSYSGAVTGGRGRWALGGLGPVRSAGGFQAKRSSEALAPGRGAGQLGLGQIDPAIAGELRNDGVDVARGPLPDRPR
jgi:hypothetical protein